MDLSVVERPLNACSSVMFRHGEGYLEGTGYRIPRHGPQPSYETCDEINASRGIGDYEPGAHYPSTGLEPVKLILVSDGRVFQEVGHEYEECSCEEWVARVREMHEEDLETYRARICLAADLAEEWGGSQEAFNLFRCAISFYGGHPGEGRVKEEGVTFWYVGRNASHDFFMGMRKDEDSVKFFRGSYEPEWETRDGEVVGGWEQSSVERFEGYYGHH